MQKTTPISQVLYLVELPDQRVKKKCIHSFLYFCDHIVFALRASLFVVHLHNCCSSDIQISGCPITWMIALNDSLMQEVVSQGHCYVFWVQECFFVLQQQQVVASYLQWYPFVFQQSTNLSLRPKNLLLAFLRCGSMKYVS